MKDYVNSAALQEYTTKLVAKLKTLFPGTPTAAATVADMTDHNKTYVYVGTESGYTAGDWYYWNGTAWTSGGPFQATSIITDTTLAVAGEAADAKATGDAIAAAKTAVLNAMAPAYSPSGTYAVGDYVNHSGAIYRCTTAITTGEAWTSGHWDAVTLGADLASRVSDLKTQLDNVDDILFEAIASTNQIAFSGTLSGSIPGITVTVTDDAIKIQGTSTAGGNVYLNFDQNTTLKAGDYVLSTTPGLTQTFDAVQVVVFGATLQSNNDNKTFTLAEDSSATRLRIHVNSGVTVDWEGHIWIDSGSTANPYSPKDSQIYEAKELVYKKQGIENAGKILGINEDGEVEPIINSPDDVVKSTIFNEGNLFDKQNIFDGYINTNGNVTGDSSLKCTDFIPVHSGYVYAYYAYVRYYAFYKEDKTLLASYSTLGDFSVYMTRMYYTSVPENAKYFRCTFANATAVENGWVSQYPEMPFPQEKTYNSLAYPYTLNPVNPCDYSELTVGTFHKCACIGDSLTFGTFNHSQTTPMDDTTRLLLSAKYSYPTQFAKLTGCEVENLGVAGATTTSWYENHSSLDYSEYDLAIIHLGVNDSAQSLTDNETLASMQNIVTMLQNASNNIKIAICSIIPAYDGAGYQAKGQLILNWAKSLNDPNIIPVDLAQYSYVRPATSYVAGHLTALGYHRMALDIARYISWHMDHNKRGFRFIQFIGTDIIHE